MLNSIKKATSYFGLPGTSGALEIDGRAHNHAPGDAPHATVTAVIDGVRRSFDVRNTDRSLIDAALAAGIDLPYSCKGGMCCTCRARLVEGQVRMDRNYSLEQDDLDAGFVLACQSHPLTDSLTLNFDER